MRVLGVDPGASGALALLVDDRLLWVEDTPTLSVRRGKTDKAEVNGYELGRLLEGKALDVAAIELVGGMTKQSASAAFNFGRAAGVVEGVLKARGLRVELMAPMTWRTVVRLRGGKDDSRAMAIRLWPEHAHRFARKKDDGRAEAALIALAWWQKHGSRMAGGVFG